ncbi:matrixin family metalloprotease [Paenarthrobacter sp. NPDC090520]|uniref:matrixin family metalloprotease n=1 Tax=unclassified Paenarthrobacter TaxID=2634190 RepID=UPI00381DD721
MAEANTKVRAMPPGDVAVFSKGGCDLVGRKIQLPSGAVATVPVPGVTIVSSSLVKDGFKEAPETYSVTSPSGQVALAERYPSGVTNFFGDPSMQSKLKETITIRETSTTSSKAALASQKCTYSSANTNGPGWPSGISYDWWLTDTATYPTPYGQPDLTVWNIEAGSKAWQNRNTACAGSYPTHKASTNYKTTTTKVAGVAFDTSCQLAPDWTSVITFKPLTGNVLGHTCWYYGVSGGLWEADIAFNKNVMWAMRDMGYLLCDPGEFILEGVAAHEFGHAFGLAHAPQTSEQVMRAQAASCTRTDTQLGTGDLASIYALYHY